MKTILIDIDLFIEIKQHLLTATKASSIFFQCPLIRLSQKTLQSLYISHQCLVHCMKWFWILYTFSWNDHFRLRLVEFNKLPIINSSSCCDWNSFLFITLYLSFQTQIPFGALFIVGNAISYRPSTISFWRLQPQDTTDSLSLDA